MHKTLARLILAFFTSLSFSHANAKPNVILINVDDLGWADVGYQGSTFYETPHIDKLSTQGAVFSNAYAAAANCAPSRASLLTGVYTPRHGVYTVNNSDRGNSADRKLIPTKNTQSIKVGELSLGQAMQRAGYITANIGKWHVSENPTRYGFDVNIAGSAEGGPYQGGYKSPYKYPNLVNDEPGEYLTDRLTDEAIKFITTHKAKPFFLYLPYFAIHTPLQPKPEVLAKFKEKKGTPAQSNATYAAMVSTLDDNIGKLMSSLNSLQLTKNTIVIFTSDNGGVYKTSKQTPLRAGKGSYYEGGIRQPLIIRWPNKVKPSKINTPVSQIDLYATLLDITNTKLNGKELDGVSLNPLLQGLTIPQRPLYWHFPVYIQGGNDQSQDPKFRTRPGSAIREGDWKLIQYFEDNSIELYNLKYDISEENNLVSSYSSKVEDLTAKLEAWRKKLNAPVPSEQNPEYLAK